ncbi:hypothetical protein O7627_12015 [Solwaraspora sp. WMMD1047]|uniref:hypothetical protein n=1 Tax=Solwaraspora sp. WMMD1047 TaxID=3016102 RepID=UPI002415A2DF|nr:hypothetical protein [Solwaraspora sp. WMMD1047]MDG4830024.1 hypothetical protein [Solwaraspora sp. WMMD1047]
MTDLGRSQLRAVIAQDWQATLVVFARGFLPHIHATFEVAAMLLRRRTLEPRPSRIFRVPMNEDAKVVEADFTRLLKMAGGRRTFGYVIRDPLPPGESLAFDRHDPAVLDRRTALSEFGRTVTLGDIFDLPASAIHPTHDRQLLHNDPTSGSVRVITGRDVRPNGIIAPPDEKTKWADVPLDPCLRPGDLLVRSIYQAHDRSGLVVAEVKAHDLPAVAGDTVIVLRPGTSLRPYELSFARQFLNTPLAKTLASYGGGARILRSALCELPVPQPDETLSSALIDLTRAAERLDEWRAEAVSLVESALAEEPQRARARLLRSGRLLRMRTEAAALLDDQGHAIRTRYPHPIAYRWRQVEAELSGEPSLHAYDAVLEAAEVLLSYTAIIAIVMARHAGVEISTVRGVRDKLAGGRAGPTFGDWVAVLTEVTGKKFKRLPNDQPLIEVRRMLAAKEMRDACARLAEHRNDRAHLRRGDLAELLPDAYAGLRVLLAGAEFLSDLRLVHLSSVRWDALRRSATVSLQELMGDHSVVPATVIEYPSNELERGSLYIMDAEGSLHLLRPFLIGRNCPTCTQWSTFHVDLTPQNSDVVLKSLEHGHTMNDDTMREPLRQVGLLPPE